MPVLAKRLVGGLFFFSFFYNHITLYYRYVYIMQFVEPIRSTKHIAQIKNQLRWSWKIRDLLLFSLGINSALRVSDLVRLRIGDVYDTQWQIRHSFDRYESKTGKRTTITITPKVRETLAHYRDTYPHVVSDDTHYLFFNTKADIRGAVHIKRCQVWVMINTRTQAIWLSGRYGGHTLRKTRWYHARINGVPLTLIQHKLNHANMWVTMRYLGITQEEIADACNKLDL